jgi:hypothetical protein
MDDVKGDLLLNRVVVTGRINPRRLRADGDFTVRKSEDIGRPGDPHEIEMQPGHGRVGHNGHGDLREVAQGEAAIVRKRNAPREREGGGPAQPRQVERHAALAVMEQGFQTTDGEWPSPTEGESVFKRYTFRGRQFLGAREDENGPGQLGFHEMRAVAGLVGSPTYAAVLVFDLDTGVGVSRRVGLSSG